MTLPRKTLEKIHELRALLNNPENCFQTHPGQVLIGVFNIYSHEISLLPCIQEPLWLELDPETGEYVRGWKVVHNCFGIPTSGEEISFEQVIEYNQSALPPRLMSLVGQYSCISSAISTRPHIFMLTLLGEQERRHHYRGFAVIPPESPDKEIRFHWNSTSLNSPFWLPVFKGMENHYQQQVKMAVSRLIPGDMKTHMPYHIHT